MGDEMALGYALGQDNNGGSNSMWGGDGSWIFAFLIIALIFGGRNGFGFGGGNSAETAGLVTRADLCSGFNFNNLDGAVRGVQQGLCDGFYAVNTSILNTNANISKAVCDLGYTTQQGFNNTGVALMQGFNGVQAGQNALSNQLASCCCDIREQIGQVRYDMATDTCAIQNTIQNTTRDIIDNNNANTRSILDFLVQDKISSLQTENQNLKLAASQAAQNTYLTNTICGQTADLIQRIAPTPVPSYSVPAPYPYCVNNTSASYGSCC